jgi:tetratricopeptide (TPR) repeat protein
MSRVFLAEERALGRKVVLKALPQEIAAALSADRFRREVQLAASLQHPHIVPVLASGDANGVLWYSMPHVEGQSLRTLLEREGALPADTAIRLLRDIADALEHAHNKGVVHRDIKPENILLSGHHAVVTDFGIAKALDTARQEGAPAATIDGLVIGTPAYMAPEQAAGDRRLDQRADIYALGAVGYEMLSGTPVFTRPTPQALIAAHIAEAPPPLDKVKSSVPSQLSQLVMFCLAKDPARRPTASAVRTTLESQGPSAVTSRRRRVILTVAATVVLLFVTSAATGFWPRRSLVARGLFEGQDRILVADVDNRTSDSTLGRALTQALRVDLTQSDIMRVVSDQEIRTALARMQQTAPTRLTDSLSQELAQREGIEAVISAEVAPVGSGFLLSARILAAGDGSVLVAVRQAARDESELLEALGKLSHELRRKIGESLRSIAATAPLERVTTGSLEALRKYSLALVALDERRDFERGEMLLREAIALDAGFAMAWRKLGIHLSNEGRRAESVTALTAAFRYRERLAGTERAWTEASYFGTVTFQTDRAIAAYRAITEADSLDWRASNNLALLLGRAGRLDEAESVLRRVLTRDSTRVNPHINLVELLINRDRVSEADSLLMVTLKRFPYDMGLAATETELRYRQDGVKGAESTLRRMLAIDRSNPRIRRVVAENRAKMAVLRGAFREAASQFDLARREALASGDLEAFFDQVSNEAAIYIMVEGAPEKGIILMERELRAHPLSELEQLDRPYLEYAYNYAAGGYVSSARRMLAEFERIPLELRRADEPFRQTTRAMIALAEGDFDQALDFMDQVTRTDDCHSCLAAERALIWDRAGNPDSAIAEYERYLVLPDAERVWSDVFYLPTVLRRLGQLHEEKDDREQALRFYGRFVDLWREADPELRPLVNEVRVRMAGLAGEP